MKEERRHLHDRLPLSAIAQHPRNRRLTQICSKRYGHSRHLYLPATTFGGFLLYLKSNHKNQRHLQTATIQAPRLSIHPRNVSPGSFKRPPAFNKTRVACVHHMSTKISKSLQSTLQGPHSNLACQSLLSGFGQPQIRSFATYDVRQDNKAIFCLLKVL